MGKTHIEGTELKTVGLKHYYSLLSVMKGRFLATMVTAFTCELISHTDTEYTGNNKDGNFCISKPKVNHLIQKKVFCDYISNDPKSSSKLHI